MENSNTSGSSFPPERRAAARARCGAATSGPWSSYLSDGEVLCFASGKPAVAGEVVHVWLRGEPEPDEYGLCDAMSESIAAARYLSCRWDTTTGESLSPEEYVPLRPADAVFIATARTDLPDALAEIDRLEADNSRLLRQVAEEREACAALVEACHDLQGKPSASVSHVHWRDIVTAIRARGVAP